MYKIDGVLIWKLQFCGLSNQVSPGSHQLTAVGLVRDVIQTRLKIQLEILIRFSLDIRLWFIWYLGQIASGPKVLRNSLVIKWRGWINLSSLLSTPGLANWFWCWGGENWEILWGLWERRGSGDGGWGNIINNNWTFNAFILLLLFHSDVFLLSF